MQRAVRLAFAGLLACSSVACRQAEVLSLEVRTVEPHAVEPGAPLRIEGGPFAPEARCTVELEGETFRVGTTPVQVDLKAPADVLSTRSLRVGLLPGAWAALGTQGTFDGSLRVVCSRAGRAAEVSVRRPLRLDLIQPLGRGTASDRELEARARRMLELVGLAPADAEPTSYGLVVGHVRAAGLAHAAGLRAGDRIVRAAGVGVHAMRDLAPAARTRRIELVVRRLESGAQAGLTLSLVRTGEHQRVPFERFSMVCGFALGGAALFRPVRSRLRRLLFTPARARSAPYERIGLWGGRSACDSGTPRSAWPAAFAHALPPVVISAAGVLLVCLEPPNFLALRSLSIYLGFAALSAALMLMNGGVNSQRVRSVAGMLGRMLVLGIAIVCGCALSGTKALDGIVAGQGGWPWHWAALQKPSLVLAVPLYLAFGSELGAATLALPVVAGASGTLAARLLDGAVIAERVVTNIALCALGVVLFAGGWQAPAELAWEAGPPRLFGAVLFVAKAWACACLLAYARDFRWAQRLRMRWTVLGCALTAAGTALWLCFDPADVRPVEAFSARMLSVALLVFAVGALVRGLCRARTSSAVASAPAANEGRPALSSDH